MLRKSLLLLVVALYTFLHACQMPKPVAGSAPDASPASQLVWRSDAFALYRDSIVQGSYSAKALSSTELMSDYRSPAAPPEPAAPARWQQTINTADLPQYKSGYPLSDALYNLALEEARRAVEPDSTFRTGQAWAGVWTRDVSYAIILAQAALQPQIAMNSLLRKVTPDGRIVQDTGTGGAYPVSTDRLIWAAAAWEVYVVTGDRAWLRRVYPVIQRSIEDDVQNAYDPQTGLVKGESSFLDWREQTYPRWMQPADIYQSENLGTNAVHYRANLVLADMARQLGDETVAARHEQLAARIRQGMNELLWQPEQGYYGQYLYGRNFLSLSPRAEALGEALSVLFGVADTAQARQVVARTPTTAYGIPCLYPQIPGVPAYHNDAVWPFVQSYWALAAAQAGNEASVLASIAALYRPAALFLTNKENFGAGNGDYAATQVNSSNMLWSLSGSLSVVYKVLFGMQFTPNELVFKPFVPRALQGERELTNFHYRAAVLSIELRGFGNQIEKVYLDGDPLARAAVPATLTGRHRVRIQLTNKVPVPVPTTLVANHFSPATPVVSYAAGRLTWAAQPDARAYRVLRNGVPIGQPLTPGFAVGGAGYGEYQVVAVGADGLESFASEPLPVGARPLLVPLATAAARRDPNQPFVAISKTENTTLTIPVTVPAAGLYAVDFRYANGNGPVNTENKCALRTLRLGQQLGTVVLPQRGADDWSWGFTNPILVRLEPGTHPLTLTLEPANENMSSTLNQARLDYLRLTRIE